MSIPSLRKVAEVIAVAAGLLTIVWFLPPAEHRALNYCPVRPDGVNQAGAVPAFARKYGYSCLQCHSNFPTLNEFGRQFKMNGYVPERGGEQGSMKSSDGTFFTEKNFPLSVVVRSRPFDNTNTVDRGFRMQPVQDMDFFLAGGDAARKVSYFGEIDANSDGGFSPGIGDLQFGYHYNDYINIIGARRGFFVMDPYQTLSNFGSPTLSPRAVAGTQIGDLPFSADTLDQTKQTIYGYGSVGKDNVGYLYYAAGVTADKGADNGSGPKDGNFRVAFDTTKGVVLGTFLSYGSEGPNPAASGVTSTDKVDFQKTGFDLLVEAGGLAFRGAFLYDHDKDVADPTASATGGLQETNRAAYGEVQYVYKRAADKIPFLVPLLRYNWYQTVNATHEFSYVTAQLAHYLQPNVKAFLEYSADLKQDVVGGSADRLPKGNRVTGQIEMGF